MAIRSMTYGVMPSREEFDEACSLVDPDNGRSVDGDGFRFGNDPRVGDCTLSSDELWDELVKAHGEYESDGESPLGDRAGDWCSSVLGCLGFEWV
jgi:hypothetical protein